MALDGILNAILSSWNCTDMKHILNISDDIL
ncbi:uncharacterized protein METZ01_LOCUS63651 [marine metagenome]|uniref:Uncharacterized protein n=1 Tax=marine metagenome TaxID=408172 RepID=A0A381T7X5_9ZZZZ